MYNKFSDDDLATMTLEEFHEAQRQAAQRSIRAWTDEREKQSRALFDLLKVVPKGAAEIYLACQLAYSSPNGDHVDFILYGDDPWQPEELKRAIDILRGIRVFSDQLDDIERALEKD
jgi:hypothetical protein